LPSYLLENQAENSNITLAAAIGQPSSRVAVCGNEAHTWRRKLKYQSQSMSLVSWHIGCSHDLDNANTTSIHQKREMK
jgi:hypothetical protein